MQILDRSVAELAVQAAFQKAERLKDTDPHKVVLWLKITKSPYNSKTRVWKITSTSSKDCELVVTAKQLSQYPGGPQALCDTLDNNHSTNSLMPLRQMLEA